MRRTIAIGTLSLMVVLAVAMVSWGQQDAPQGAGAGQSQHQMGAGGQHPWAGGEHRFAEGGRGPFDGQGRWGGGFDGHRMGMRRGGHRGFGGGEGMMRLADNPRVREYLGLSPDQVGKLHTIALDEAKASVQNRAQMELARIDLRELMRGDNPDQGAIDQKIDEMSALRGKIEKQRVDAMLAARDVLTPEQRTKIKTFMENRGAGGPGGGRMMERRGGPGGRTPGHMGAAPGGSNSKPQAPPAQ